MKRIAFSLLLTSSIFVFFGCETTAEHFVRKDNKK